MMNGGSSRSSRFPFTPSQWQELEHQALIYKYMASGISIPPDLLFSIKRGYHLDHSRLFPPQHLGWNYLQMGLGRKIDPEPGRCRRTDGKKWRCSKEAYPDSKYCERHMHRGKNRSRKPVEQSPAAPPTNTDDAAAPSSSTTTTILSITNNNNSLSPLSSASLSSHQHQHQPSSRSSNSIGFSFQDNNAAPLFLDTQTNTDCSFTTIASTLIITTTTQSISRVVVATWLLGKKKSHIIRRPPFIVSSMNGLTRVEEAHPGLIWMINLPLLSFPFPSPHPLMTSQPSFQGTLEMVKLSFQKWDLPLGMWVRVRLNQRANNVLWQGMSGVCTWTWTWTWL
ncbi:growth-regulating factor 4 isoform X2 [Arachis ipaensis]|uniref:growth-regulating factor 4 isoform X2 n=1 Tax=Arachis ipaensis TaxID=130454 RepID=UPI000A2B1F27|nr:growth-regulating factor 4 isoform X2 [Arachis ipaensis]